MYPLDRTSLCAHRSIIPDDLSLCIDGTGTVAIRSSKEWAKKLGFTSVAFPWEDFERAPPGLLALDNLIYFARNHTDDYRRLVLENSRLDLYLSL